MSAACCTCTFEDTSFLAGTCGPDYTTFMGLVELMLRSRCDITDACNRAGRFNYRVPSEGADFDFVVVGAGVGGSVVAGRLSENPDWKVLLVEAGPEEPTITMIPAFAVGGVGTHVDWNYTTEPETKACLQTGGVCSWPRGKMVGGTSAITGMMYTRGSDDIYDTWEEMGAEGWGSDDVLPFFKRSEGNRDHGFVEEEFHGRDGPLTVQRFPWQPPMLASMMEGAREMGYPAGGDLNGRNRTGLSPGQVMLRDGLRVTTARAYVRPNSGKPNLKVATNTHVARVLVNPETNRAVGIEIVDESGKRTEVMARKEVILGAGAIGSPQLLLLSGIGPREDLESLGIPVVQDLPGVGRNLRNHVSVSFGYQIDDPGTTLLTASVLDEFVRTRTGPMSSTGLTQTCAFFDSKYTDVDKPDLQVFMDGFGASCSRTGLEGECSNGSVSGGCAPRYINVRPTNVRPRSTGVLKLRSANPLEYPEMRPNYFEDEHDLDVLVDGVRVMQRLCRTEALKKWGMRPLTYPKAGCTQHEYDSDEYWKCVIRTYTGPENHQGGTCRMGAADDSQAVVDPKLCVRGIDGLRVADASVFPVLPNSNPIAAITMIGERAAQFILDEWM